jgi:hypothetical protein
MTIMPNRFITKLILCIALFIGATSHAANPATFSRVTLDTDGDFDGSYLDETDATNINAVTTAGWELLDDSDAATMRETLEVDNRPKVVATNSTGQTLTDGILAAVTFDTDVYDRWEMHSTEADTSRFYAPTTGWYHVAYRTSFIANATGGRMAFVSKNGATGASDPRFAMDVRGNAGASLLTVISGNDYIYLLEDEYVSLHALQSSTGNLNIGSSSVPYQTTFKMRLVDEVEELAAPLDVNMGFEYTKYANYAEFESALDDLEANGSVPVTVSTDRTSYTGGYPLYWVTVGNPELPALVMVSAMHGRNEWMGANIMVGFLNKLVDPEDDQAAFNAQLLDRVCIVSVPMVNPWGYFADADGVHGNGHTAMVSDIESYSNHDTTLYDEYTAGVNLNRNFDYNWEAYGVLPFLVSSYWTGTDYGTANYFMMPYVMVGEVLTYDPTNEYEDHILGPDPHFYSWKGSAPLSEPETQLIDDLFDWYNVVGFSDWHQMNPWQSNNTSYTHTTLPDKTAVRAWISAAVARVNARHSGDDLPAVNHTDADTYDGSAPFSINWAYNVKGAKTIGWEMGQDYPEEFVTDAYMEMMYRTLYWQAP